MTDNTPANTTTDAPVAGDPQPGPVGMNQETAKTEKKPAKARSRSTAKKQNAREKAATTSGSGKKVRKRITAPSRLRDIEEKWRDGKLPGNIAVSHSGSGFKAYEFVSED